MKNTNKAGNGTIAFVFQNVERDIRRGKSSVEIAEKYHRNPDEIIPLIERINDGRGKDSSRAREVKSILARNDEQYARKELARKKNAAKAAEPKEKSAMQIDPKEALKKQEAVVASLKVEYSEKAMELATAQTMHTQANEQLEVAKGKYHELEKLLAEAERVFKNAGTAVRQAANRVAKAEAAYHAIQEKIVLEEDKLEAMVPPKLIHFSAQHLIQKGERNLYVSQFDYERLPGELKALVIPVVLDEDVQIINPGDFRTFHRTLNATELDGMYAYVEAYIYLYYRQEMDNLELFCENQMIRNYALLQSERL